MFHFGTMCKLFVSSKTFWQNGKLLSFRLLLKFIPIFTCGTLLERFINSGYINPQHAQSKNN